MRDEQAEHRNMQVNDSSWPDAEVFVLSPAPITRLFSTAAVVLSLCTTVISYPTGTKPIFVCCSKIPKEWKINARKVRYATFAAKCRNRYSADAT